jgi:signal transduction histidine kinase
MIGDKSEHESEPDHRSEPTGESRPRFADGTARTHLQPRDDGIVHDLRGPLATINLEASLLEDQIELVGGPSTRRALQRIRLNVDYLARMVDDLLDLTAIDRGRLTIRNTKTELRTLLEQVIERAIATRDRDRVVLEAPKPITVSADDLRIERVVANLIQNALKYTPSRSAIVVRLDGGATMARVSVTDAGPGIAPEERESIFEAFYRGASTSPHDGSGLGLYVSKRIVEAHGGRIGVDRAPDRGSCFYFELPVT